MSSCTTCEFPKCGNTQEIANAEGKPFKLNRIPISRPLSDKWYLVFRFRLDDRIGQSILICNKHFDATNRRLILPHPIKKSVNKHYDYARSQPVRDVAPVREVPSKRKAAQESINRIHESFKDDDPPATAPVEQLPIKKESADAEFEPEDDDPHDDYQPDDSDDEDYEEKVVKQPTPRKKMGRPRKSDLPAIREAADPDWGTKSNDSLVPKKKIGRPRKVDQVVVAAPVTAISSPKQTDVFFESQPHPIATVEIKQETEVKQHKSWWGDDSDSDDHFGADNSGAVDEYGDETFADNRASSPEPDAPIPMETETVVNLNDSIMTTGSEPQIKTEEQDLDTIRDIKVTLEKIDDWYEDTYNKPIEDACYEVLEYEGIRDTERKTFKQQKQELMEKYRRHLHQFHRAKWRNEQLMREIKIKTNKMAFIKNAFSKKSDEEE